MRDWNLPGDPLFVSANPMQCDSLVFISFLIEIYLYSLLLLSILPFFFSSTAAIFPVVTFFSRVENMIDRINNSREKNFPNGFSLIKGNRIKLWKTRSWLKDFEKLLNFLITNYFVSCFTPLYELISSASSENLTIYHFAFCLIHLQKSLFTV